MKKALGTLGLTIVLLLIMDAMVAAVLHVAEARGKLPKLVRYFEYGRSVPGKLERWENNPDQPDNLYDFAWRDAAVAGSSRKFNAEPADIGPVVRSYGMSFVNRIVKAGVRQDPQVPWDAHSGPAAPPNFTYMAFLADRASRRPGDIAVLGILSSSVAAMGAMSSSTWSFEQPAPFTYPVYWPDGEDGLRWEDPLVTSSQAQRALRNDPAAARAWAGQLAQEDLFYSLTTFGATWLDLSPFARLVRRSAAIGHIEKTKTRILSGGVYPYREVLQTMIRSFAETALADGQSPVVVLVQSRDPNDPDVLAIARPVLDAHQILYLATVDHFDPRNASGFLPDGHYKPEVDAMFGEHFRTIIEAPLAQARP